MAKSNAERQAAFRERVRQRLALVPKPFVMPEFGRLPSLTGSDKQVNWATDIRAQFMGALQVFACRAESSPAAVDQMAERMAFRAERIVLPLAEFNQARSIARIYPRIDGKALTAAITSIRGIRSAHWWIEHRFSSATGLVEDLLLSSAPTAANPAPDTSAALAAAEAMSEATLAPAEDIEARRITVEASMPTANSIRFQAPYSERFMALVKERKFGWTEPYWSRSSYADADLFAEICTILLADGFNVCIFDAALREKVVNSDYVPEPERVLEAHKNKKGGLQFRFRWRTYGKFVEHLRRLPGAKAFDDAVLVPASRWEDVIDLAETWGFVRRPSADKVVELGRALELKMTRVSPEVKTFGHVELSTALAPATGEIDRDLLDAD